MLNCLLHAPGRRLGSPLGRRTGAPLMLAVMVVLSGCVAQPAPEPASLQTGAPPWSAPRDAVSNIRAAGLPEQPLSETSDPWILRLEILVEGRAVPLAPFIGVDRPRAVQAPVHTHDDSGEVWLEGQGNRAVTLAQFFTVWGVRLTDECLGATCGQVTVVADGRPAPAPAGDLVLRGHRVVRVEARARP